MMLQNKSAVMVP